MTFARSDVFNRPPRIPLPSVEGKIDLPSPPPPQSESTRSFLTSLLPLGSVVMLGIFYLLIGSSNGASGGNPVIFVLPMLMMSVISALTGMLTYSSQRQTQRARSVNQRREYHRLLDRREARIQAARDLQIAYTEVNSPPPTQVLKIVLEGDNRQWGRRLSDDDFTTIRLGIGEAAAEVVVTYPDPDIETPDTARVMDIAFKYSTVPTMPLTINLRDTGSLGIAGVRKRIVPFAYSLLTQLATHHSPTELQLYILASESSYHQWNWARWLPHTSDNSVGGFPTHIAYHTDDVHRLLASLAQSVDQRRESKSEDGAYVVVLIDDLAAVQSEVAFSTLLNGHKYGFTTLCLVNHFEETPGECAGVIELVSTDQFNVRLSNAPRVELTGKGESLTRAQVEVMARHMASVDVQAPVGSGQIPTGLDFLELFNVQTIPALNIAHRWHKRWKMRLKQGVLPFDVAIGSTSLVDKLHIHLADNIHGPHGLVAGTTGSGKSELLRTLVAALALDHHPYFVNFLLIDYKGGSTFNVFKNLPHAVGNITNLDRAEALRALEAIRSENQRRQLFLNRVECSDIAEYHRRLEQFSEIPRDWEPLPHLFIIIDEFAELANELPNFIPQLVSTVRVGRTLGMHLILATQRPANYVNDEMRANLQFRIALRVQTPEDSREILRSPDAFYLQTNLPGRAYFQVGSGSLRQFQVARVNVDYDPERAIANSKARLLEFERAEPLAKSNDLAVVTTTAEERSTIIGELSRAMAYEYEQVANLPPMPPILLDSLRPEIALGDVLAMSSGGWQVHELPPASAGNTTSIDEIQKNVDQVQKTINEAVTRGWDYTDGKPQWARAPIGLIDDLRDRAIKPLYIDLTNGHWLIAGVPGSGKTTALRTLTMSFAQTFRPDEAAIYILSFGGRSLDALGSLPHVGAVIHSDERERVVRLLRHLTNLRNDRARELAAYGADDIIRYNQRIQRRNAEDERSLSDLMAFIAIVIDNFAELVNNFSEEIEDLIRLLRDGRSYGIHFVITVNQMSEIPFKMQNLVENRVALRLAERGDYLSMLGEVGEREIPSRPGAGAIRGKPPYHIQIALPTHPAQHEDYLQRVIEAIAHSAEDHNITPQAQPVHELPETVPLEAGGIVVGHKFDTGLVASIVYHQPIHEPPYPRLTTPIGLDGWDLRKVEFEWSGESDHYLIAGGIGSGKTTLLKTLVLSAAYAYAPSEVKIVVIDFGGGMRSFEDLKHVHYISDETLFVEEMRCLGGELAWRRAQATAERERRRASGEPMDAATISALFPRLILAFDDYELLDENVANRTVKEQLISQLVFTVRRGADLGVHILLASENNTVAKASDALLRQIKLLRSGFALVSAEALDALGTRATSQMRRDILPEGRGYLITRRTARLVQFATILEERKLIQHVNRLWASEDSFVWDHCPDTADIPPQPVNKAGVPADDETNNTVANFMVDWQGMLSDYERQQRGE